MIDSAYLQLKETEIEDCLRLARQSPRQRYPMLLHEPGDDFNRVFNFILYDSYMQPHLHPGKEKVEEIHIISGRVATIFFNDQGLVAEVVLLEKGRVDYVKVPAFAWHTYVMLTESAITYETMMGVYDPKTWKHFAPWAPKEECLESKAYLASLRESVDKHLIRSE